MLPDAAAGVVAYSACATQWRYGGMGSRTGMDYPACLALLDRYLPQWQDGGGSAFVDVTVTDLMADVQVIESAMLVADGERAARDHPTPG